MGKSYVVKELQGVKVRVYANEGETDEEFHRRMKNEEDVSVQNDIVLAYQKQYYRKKRNEYQRNYYQRHKEEIKQRQNERYHEHRNVALAEIDGLKQKLKDVTKDRDDATDASMRFKFQLEEAQRDIQRLKDEVERLRGQSEGCSNEVKPTTIKLVRPTAPVGNSMFAMPELKPAVQTANQTAGNASETLSEVGEGSEVDQSVDEILRMLSE